MGLSPSDVGIGYSDDVDRMILKSDRAAVMVEHCNAMGSQGIGHSALIIYVVMVPQDGEATEGCFQTGKGRRYRAWWHTPAAE
jgi:hypothetical protein